MPVDAQVVRRAAALQARARRQAGRRRLPPGLVARPYVLIASNEDPEIAQLGAVDMDPALYDGAQLGGLFSFVGGLAKGALNLAGSAAGVGPILGGGGSSGADPVSGVKPKDQKDANRFASNTQFANAWIGGSAADGQHLLDLSGHGRAGQGWATDTARRDAWAKYQRAQQTIGNRAPGGAVPIVGTFPVSQPARPTVSVPQILQGAAQQVLQQAGVIPDSSAAGGAPYVPDYFPGPGQAPAPEPQKQNLGLWLGAAGLGLAALTVLGSGRRR